MLAEFLLYKVCAAEMHQHQEEATEQCSVASVFVEYRDLNVLKKGHKERGRFRICPIPKARPGAPTSKLLLHPCPSGQSVSYSISLKICAKPICVKKILTILNNSSFAL